MKKIDVEVEPCMLMSSRAHMMLCRNDELIVLACLGVVVVCRNG